MEIRKNGLHVSELEFPSRDKKLPGEEPEKPRGPVVVEGQLHMRAGDVCEVEIDGIGTLSNEVIADPTPR